MDKTEPKPMYASLAESNMDHSLNVSKAKLILRLTRRLRNFLPPPLNIHCGIADIHPDKITLYGHTSAWSYKLKRHSRHIKRFLSENGISIDEIKLRFIVVLELKPLIAKSIPKPTLSISAKKIINKEAEKISDPELRKMVQNFTRKPS